MFNRILHPERYHGNSGKRPFFEGWYFKLVSKDQRKSYIIIPGVFLDRSDSRSKAFIQLMDGGTLKSDFIEFPIDVFSSSKNSFDIRIGNNRFTQEEVNLDIKRNDIQVQADLKFHRLKPWPVTLLSPGIMGWYAWVPFMECFHGVLSMDHLTGGSMFINEAQINFDGGKGYIEKDWGTAFPEAWVWQQSNHFSEEGVSLSASIAIIPWIGKAFPGFIIGFLWEGRLYRFATYTGARTTRINIKKNEIFWDVEDRKHRLEMSTLRGEASTLVAPTPEGMVRQIKESVHSQIEVKLFRKIKTGKTLIYQGRGHHGGLEVEGNIQKLLRMVQDEMSR